MKSSTEPIICVKDLTVGYDGLTVLRDISFDVPPGSVYLIIGPSGCGKSTLLKNMIGLNSPISGDVLIDGDNFVQATGQDRDRMIRKFGVAYQNSALFGSMSVYENINLVLKEFTNLTEPIRRCICNAKLSLVGLEDSGEKLPSQLSGGMKKRAAIARAMALDPQILFLDEPSAGLDPATSAGIDELILKLSKSLGVTFVIVSHELQSIFKIADYSIMLDDEEKTIIAHGTIEKLRNTRDNKKVQDFINRKAEK